MDSVSDAVAKLQGLSAKRARKVVSLIEDLAELEALEREADLKAARAVLTNPGPTVSYDQLRDELGLNR